MASSDQLIAEGFAATSHDEVIAAFHARMQAIGFSDSFHARLKHVFSEKPRSLDNLRIWRNWDENWKALYESRRLERVDFVFNRAGETTGPLIRFRAPTYELCPAEREFLALAEEHGRLNGVALPVRTRGVVSGGFSVTGAESEPTEEQIAHFASAAIIAEFHLQALDRAQISQAHGLSARELKLIRLFASGRSMVQIAACLGTSEQWIRKSFVVLRDKLGAKNNGQLVYKALHLGLID